MAKDYYKILNLDKHASQSDIKKSYKKLALKYHPDKNISNKKKNEEIFKDISEAYQILGDPNNRKKYDSLYNLENIIELTQEDLNKIFGLFKKPSQVFSDVFDYIPNEYQEVGKSLVNYFFEDETVLKNELDNLEFSKIYQQIKKGLLDIPKKAFSPKLTYSQIFSKVAQIVFYIFYYCSFYFYNKLTQNY